MTRTITIDPVTRIEGHARITLQLDTGGHLVEARFHVTEFRGFERFCEGRPFQEMAAITSRICGICPVSHLLAAARTGDRLLAVRIPPAAAKLRRLLNLAQISQSHALSFFHLSSPDFLLGWDSDPARRNVFGLMAAEPELARAGIRLRQFGQGIIERLAGRRIHSAWAVPGGVRSPLSLEDRDRILKDLPEAMAATALALERFQRLLDGPLQPEMNSFGNFPSLFMALVGPGGRWEHLDGSDDAWEEPPCGDRSAPRSGPDSQPAPTPGGLRIVAADGRVLAEGLRGDDYPTFLAEAVEPWSYLKFPYYRPLGYPEGIYRVGPLARLNVCERIGTPWADAELADLRQRCGRVALSSFVYHQARLVEIVACLEAIESLLHDPELQDPHVRARASLNALEAVGVGEAPRGTLFHHYRVDEQGLITHVNLVIATGQNNLAMNRTVLQIAREVLPDPVPASIPEALLNRIEAGIRCFDPCLSCSTHAAGAMPIRLELRAADGRLLAEQVRN
jgi:NAD-reducing hydrogenase large subunit